MAGGYGIAFFQALKSQILEPPMFAKIALQNFRDSSCKFRPLKNIFGMLENRHSIRHQSTPHYQKNPRVRKIFVRNSGVGNGCANVMGAW